MLNSIYMKNAISKIFIATLLVVTAGSLFAADPQVTGAAVSPSPIVSPTGISVSFNTTNLGSATNSSAVTITVSLALLAPADNFVIGTNITGPGAALFTWSYDAGIKMFTGVLSSNWAQFDGGAVVISNLVSTGITLPGAEGNGLNVNVVAPSAVNTSTNNDNTSAYTSSSAALPVKLSDFNVTKEESVSQLSWTTTEETNSNFFEVQHSADAKSWKALGRVKSNDKGRAVNNYTFTHNSPLNGTNYYRLKMVDQDATFAYSGIKAVNFENLFKARLFPNPVSSTLTIETRNWAEVTSVELINASGVSVYSSGTKPVSSIDVKNLSSGIYLVKLVNKDGTVDKLKTIVAR